MTIPSCASRLTFRHAAGKGAAANQQPDWTATPIDREHTPRAAA